MFNLSYMKPSEIAGIIEVNRPIFQLGRITDIHGNKWDIRGIIRNYVQACPLDSLHDYYKSTSNESWGLVQQTWKPYLIKIVRNDNKWKNFYKKWKKII